MAGAIRSHSPNSLSKEDIVMSKRDPIIELEPRNPFSWKIVAAALVAWVLIFAAMIELKLTVLRLLLPLLAMLLVIYLAVCTVYLLKNRR
jgi:hypothetical protein